MALYGNSMKLEKAASQLEALGNPTRLRLYRALVRAGEEGLPVGSVQEKLRIPASTLSHHLKRLVGTGLVTQERQATTLICRASYPGMDALIGYLADQCCADVSRPPVANEVAG
jgi:DNA-binding transcriptional ArsR family regulator